jgi:hypothetical protein
LTNQPTTNQPTTNQPTNEPAITEWMGTAEIAVASVQHLRARQPRARWRDLLPDLPQLGAGRLQQTAPSGVLTRRPTNQPVNQSPTVQFTDEPQTSHPFGQGLGQRAAAAAPASAFAARTRGVSCCANCHA